MAEPRKYHCIGCRRNVLATSDDHYRKHDRVKGTECARSKRDIPTWLLRRGPESGPETDTPVKGRDYADCPQCDASPVLDGASGHFTDHTREGETPTSPRVPCGMGGKPYEASEEGPCPASDTPESRASEDDAASVSSSSCPSPSPNESEEMISQWAATAREIEDRKLPPSPESTTTPQDSPPRPDAPEAPPSVASTATRSIAPGSPAPTDAGTSPETANGQRGTAKEAVPVRPCHIAKDHKPHKWMHERRQAQCPGKPAPEGTASTEPAPTTRPAEVAATASEAASSRENGSRNELGVAAVARLSRKSAPTPDVTPADSALLSGAGAPAWTELPPEEHTTTDAQLAKVAAVVVKRRNPPTTGTAASASAATTTEPLFAQPGSPFSQPAKPPAAVPAVPMTVMAEQVAARMKELFFAYDNRRAADNRSAQTTLGPSEVGSPCDRRIAMSLLRVPPVNPGGDGWAAFVGTSIHAGLAEMFMWADAGTGRFAVEQRLTFPNEHVPKGTADLLDRTLCMVDDHKAMGRWSLDKLKSQGMTPTQRVQLHTYGFGQRLKGETVDFVALISWPREASTLADLYVVVEPYDPQIARDALARVDRIAETTQGLSTGENAIPALEVASYFPVADDCKFCPFHAPGDAAMERGCNGRQ